MQFVLWLVQLPLSCLLRLHLEHLGAERLKNVGVEDLGQAEFLSMAAADDSTVLVDLLSALGRRGDESDVDRCWTDDRRRALFGRV